jgi:hypothetical protein
MEMGHRGEKDEQEKESQAREHPALPEQPRGGWGEGFKRMHDRPEDAEVGRFSRGQERVERADADLQQTKPRFSRGQEVMSDDRDEKEREGRFSSGQEELEEL